MNVNKENVNETTNILREAEKIIYGDREKTYGHPAKNLNVIAQMWEAYLAGRSSHGPLNKYDVACMMILLKVARLANTPDHVDSLVDTCGYAALIERCIKDEEIPF